MSGGHGTGTKPSDRREPHAGFGSSTVERSVERSRRFRPRQSVYGFSIFASPLMYAFIRRVIPSNNVMSGERTRSTSRIGDAIRSDHRSAFPRPNAFGDDLAEHEDEKARTHGRHRDRGTGGR